MSELLRPLIAVALLAELSSISASAAGQQLLPVPYPEMLGPNAQIGGGAPDPHRGLLPDPVPQSLGSNALGNPRPRRRHSHQQLLRTPTGRNIIVGARTA